MPSAAEHAADADRTDKVPVLLLKTKSAPTDAYEETLRSASFPRGEFDPRFVPVLRHVFDAAGTQRLKSLLEARQIDSRAGSRYGGIVFTSQRAVEAFSQALSDSKGARGE